jgi:hypothetical protein
VQRGEAEFDQSHQSSSFRNSTYNPVFVFGAGQRNSLRCLSRIPTAKAEELSQLVESVVKFDVLHPGLLDALCCHTVPRQFAEDVEERLRQSENWTIGEKLKIADWLHSCDSPLWQSWLGDHIKFPIIEVKSSPLCSELFRQSWSQFHQPIPASIYCPDHVIEGLTAAEGPTPSSMEKYVIAHKRFAANPNSSDAAVSLLKAAVACDLQPTVAALLENHYLDKFFFQADVIRAFHWLSWTSYGTIKQSFAQRTLKLQGSTDKEALRFLAIQCWARYEASEAIGLFEKLLAQSDSVDPIIAREYLTAFAVAGNRPNQTANQMLKLLEADSNGQKLFKWLDLLIRRSRRDVLDRKVAQELAETLDLPPVTDPLFVPLASVLQRLYCVSHGVEQDWPLIENRLQKVDPMWKLRLPYYEREYVALYNGLKTAETDPLRLAVHVRKSLILPINLKWIERILALMQGGNRGALLTDDEDGAPSALGLLLIDVCIRTVEFLLAEGRLVGEQEDISLCGGNPLVVATTLYNRLKSDVVDGV